MASFYFTDLGWTRFMECFRVELGGNASRLITEIEKLTKQDHKRFGGSERTTRRILNRTPVREGYLTTACKAVGFDAQSEIHYVATRDEARPYLGMIYED